MAESLGTAVLYLTTKNAGLVAGLAAAKKSTSKQLAAMAAAGAAMNKKLTLPILAVGAASVHMSAQFESEMSKMIGLVGISSKQVEKWKGDILKLAPEVSKSPQELAEALFFVTSAGIKGAAAIDVLTISAKASATGMGETSVLADAITSAINAYGAANITAAQAGDILVATVREGKAEASAIAPVLGNLLPLASELGVGFEEVGGSIAQMTRLGMSAPNAATALQAVMSGLLRPTQQASDKLESVGLSAAGLRDQLDKKGVISVLATLNDKFDGNVEAMGQVFPNVRALKGALALAGKAGASTGKVFDGVKNSTGALDYAFEEVSKDAAFKFDQAMASIKVALINLGNVLLPIAKRAADAITGILTAFSGLSSEQKKFIVVVLGVLAALGPMVKLITTITLAVKGLAIAAGFLAANPAVLLLAAFVALTVAIIVLYRKNEAFRNAVQAAGRAILTAYNAVKTAVIAVRQAMVTAFNAVLNWLKSNWRTIVTIISGPFAPLVALATNAFGIRSALVGAFTAVVAAVRSAMTRVIGAVRGAVGAVTGAARAIGRGIVNGVRTAVQALSALRSWLWTQVSSGISSVAGSALAGAGAIGRAIVQGVWAGIQSMAGWLQDKIAGWASGLLDGAMSKLGIGSPSKVAARDLGVPIAQGVAVGIKKQQGKVKATLTNVIRTAISEAKQNVVNLSQSVGDTLSSAIDESTRRKLAVYDNGPTGQKLKALNDQLEAESNARQQADLQAAIDGAETEQEKQEAIAALRTWGMEQERNRLQMELEFEKQKVQEAADARKTALTQGLADLADILNRGHITHEEYNARVQALIASQAPEYKNLGDLLGHAQARGYIDTYNAMLAQAGLTQAFGIVPGGGADMGIVDPRIAAKKELQGILKKLTGRATSTSSPGGKTITKAESTAINAIKARIKALGLERGGIIEGALGRDTAGLFALSSGEGVFRRSAMEGMQRWFEGGGQQGGIVIEFNGPVIGAGDTRTLGRELAKIIQPELNRRVALS